MSVRIVEAALLILYSTFLLHSLGIGTAQIVAQLLSYN